MTSSPAGINCGADCSEPYNLNTTVTLTAIPTAGWRIIRLNQYRTGTDTTCKVTMTIVRSVKATFTQ